MDSDSYRTAFPQLAVVTHEISKVGANGLPDPDYNDNLQQFDSDVRAAFEDGGNGQTVLIETFGGKRKYYIYVGPETNLGEKTASVSQRYPHERLSWSAHPDAEWSFIKRYAKQFFEG